ncbi:MAG TPA: 23S rRNA (uracil(1939)-C(5))-methyltransferase RlmD [Bacteroidales bacterium]|nr:23S rRNA (uracil(1939)-C(5))-methyltransferase RlmD [Bacteroidales bacterium]HOU95528.1 23S rRNA (uracil(1939)-C(5))-methyltransferase RlmD [Bacteroidales bacterium]HQG36149.1 23S rRNA (uracil(1939)-C(5))-methyltransferase RlmD [Bacteroidales bacterium]HQG53401.1 23S rRNA (uracil(1939)-C(5))-methyltransferase RlmD [Bacteroidales bacterium]HQJ20313.1 23S rRNA (uracil(1939)-C(5))-methyltransferase RlmD [Bacteroidales bacterium]
MSSSEKPSLIEKVKISGMDSEGRAVARIDGMVLFVPLSVPGDVVDIRITARKKNYLEGVAVKFHEYSPERVNPICAHFGECGGCTWQHICYEKQLVYKKKIVEDNIERIGKVYPENVMPVLESPQKYYYRNKLEYTFSSRRWLTENEILSGEEPDREKALGFHKRGFFDRVIDIKECYLQPEPANRIRNAIRDYALTLNLQFYNVKSHTGFLRNLIIRNSSDGQIMVIMVFSQYDKKHIEGLLDFIKKEFPQVTSLFYVINTKRNDSISDMEAIHYYGEDYLFENMNGLKYRVGPKSFYQVNTLQAARLYETIKRMACLTGKEVVYDLYTGTGSIACYISAEAASVTGVECVAEAVEDAKANASLNGCSNVKFIEGDIKKMLSGGIFDEYGYPDVVITDPPRSGMHGEVIRSLLSAAPSRIVYVSCNPSTQARDISIISEKYRVETMQPVDMFPQTHHVENVTLLVRR